MQLILKLESSPTKGEPPQKRAWISGNKSIVLGRQGTDFRLPQDLQISSSHCKISCDGQRYLLEDLKSTNGTFLNDVRIKRARLTQGDRIRVGLTVLSVEIAGAAAAAEVDTGPDMVRASSNLNILGDEPPAKAARNEPVRVFNDTQYQYALVPGRVRFPGHSLTLVAKATFDLQHGGVVKPAKEQIPVDGPVPYPDAEHELAAPRYASDVACFKPKADLLLIGSCHAPGGQPTTQCEVEFRVGKTARRLIVHGKRRWEGLFGSAISEPQPFTQQPLRYEFAYGGEGFPRNPTGIGHVRIDATEEGRTKIPLPSIEDPQRQIHLRTERPEPAGFGPLGEQWEQRKKHLGTYDDAWLKERWPWFASDFNWAFCNAAPEAQQTEYLRGDEELLLENLHPKHAKLTSRLPGRRVRCFMYEVHGEERAFREVSMFLDTLWVDADAGKIVMVWRGVAAVTSADLSEIRSIFFMDESLTAPRSSQDCLLAFRKARSDWEAEWESEDEPPADFGTTAPAEEPTEGEPEPQDAESLQLAELQAKNQQDLRQTMIAGGIDPDNLPVPTEAERREAIAFLRSQGAEIEDDTAPQEESPWTRARVEEHARSESPSFEDEDLHGLDLSGLKLTGLDFSGANLEGVNLTGADLTSAVFRAANLNQANLTGATLTQTNFTEAALTAADLSKVHGEGAVFQEARLLGANLTDAALPSSNFQEATLAGAKLPRFQAPLGMLAGAHLPGTLLKEAHLQEADLTGADLSACDLSGAQLAGATLKKAQLTGANLERVQAQGAFFIEAKMNDARLTEAKLDGADFTRALLHRTSLERAQLREATLEEADGRQANLSKADLTGARGSAARFAGAKFRQARLDKSTWTGAALGTSDFSGSTAPDCDFSGAALERAIMTGVDLRRSRLDEANLRHAKLRQVNLFEASLTKADLSDADLTDANCYGADFADAILDRLKRDGANVKLTRLAKV